MGGVPHENERRFRRVQKMWFVHYTRAEAPDASRAMGSVKDLSVGGTCFRSEEVLEVNTRLTMMFNLPVPVLRSVHGTIVWRRELRPGQYEYGVAFEALSPDAAGVLQQYVTRLLGREP